MKKPNTDLAQLTFNKEVKLAYYNILRYAKQLLSTIERDEFRYSMQREDRSAIKPNTIIHEIINPLIYLRLECLDNSELAIHWGFAETLDKKQFSSLTAEFMRYIYRKTSKDVTAINIEYAVRTDWIITTCSEMYEYIEEYNKHHEFRLIKYKPANIRRKQMLAVA